jgi:hypothetical protein
VVERHLARLDAAGATLRPGQEVLHASARLGEIRVRVVE